MGYIYNLSFDIPEKIKGTNEKNSLDRRSLVKMLIASRVIDANYWFGICDENHNLRKTVNIVYPVKTTMIFKSDLNKAEIANVLFAFKDNIYFVLTIVEEDQKDYLARIMEDHQLQDDFSNEVDEIKEELKRSYNP